MLWILLEFSLEPLPLPVQILHLSLAAKTFQLVVLSWEIALPPLVHSLPLTLVGLHYELGRRRVARLVNLLALAWERGILWMSPE
jgi:hypothetical protein